MTDPFVYDPSSSDFASNAYRLYKILRDDYPIYRNEERGTWALSRYDDVRNAAADWEVFSSQNTSISRGLRPMIQQMDPPRHDRLREIMWKAFSPRRVAAMEGQIRQVAMELIDDFADQGRSDLLHSFASQLPSRVIGELIGIPPDRRLAFLEWTEALITANPGRNWETNPFENIYAEYEVLLEERRDKPGDDLMTALIGVEIDGHKLSQEELLGFCFLLVVGGNDTTTNLIANSAVLLAQHPDQRAELVHDPSLIPAAVEEVLRCESPTQALPRIAMRDSEIHGEKIRAGEEVSLIWGSANRDERRFADPERFDIHRTNNRHLALGHGVHFCMGAHLARLEGRVAIEVLLTRMPDFELESPPTWLPSPWARAHGSVPIQFDPVVANGSRG